MFAASLSFSVATMSKTLRGVAGFPGNTLPTVATMSKTLRGVAGFPETTLPPTWPPTSWRDGPIDDINDCRETALPTCCRTLGGGEKERTAQKEENATSREKHFAAAGLLASIQVGPFPSIL